MMILNQIREWINIRLYPSKRRVLLFLRYSSFFVALVTLCALVINYGYELSGEDRRMVYQIVRFSLVFYLLKYIVKIIYDFHPIEFIKSTLTEAFLMLFILVNLLTIHFFNFNVLTFLGNLFDIGDINHFFEVGIQVYFLIVFLIEVGKATSVLEKVNVSPSTLFIFSFIILISIGTALLMMPEMNTVGKSPRFIDALFTSISASCVTGLTVVDTGEFWSVKGQFVIMVLIQFGGLSIISFATLLVLFTRNNIGIRQQSIMQNNLLADSLSSSSGLLKRIFYYTFLFEMVGATLLYLSYYGRTDGSVGNNIFNALFHSISAFNNAGFSTHIGGFTSEEVANIYVLHILIAFLIIFGSLGFSNIFDLFSIRRRRKEQKKPWLGLKIDTKISLYASSILILLGSVLFYFLEEKNVLSDKDFYARITTSFFQSVTTRTAGFNTVDIGSLQMSTLIIFIFLMFIGASPGSTGGGIKTNTFVLIFLGTYTIIRGRARFELFKRTIPHDLVLKAYSIMLFAISIISLGIFLLSLFEPQFSLIQISFEQVSAFATVGLSTGITPYLSTAGKIIIMFTMFIGRVGPLTLAYSLLRQTRANAYKYPEARMMVG
ncbi:TrkH family potassium uptake protein [Thermaurantimonas aggregans]|uniref:TrkH family potassium uptake protein n=1 Tax=Thermaurantimonas aggregans TaxID=2173829 RepID=UPI0023F541BF|nr:potassium transporter TrkG [Thermaurantimonas aggregans]MCX8149173.1 potassium transporter KtrB [Thermaurantimonas aggregans]